MKIAASISVGRLAPKHSLNVDNIRAISKNVTPKLIRDDVVIIDRLRGRDGKYMTIEEYPAHKKTPGCGGCETELLPVKRTMK